MNEDERGITPPDVTAMTVEARSDYEARITVERGNGASVQTMELTTLEWKMLEGLLGTFGQGYSPSVSAEFKAMPVWHGGSGGPPPPR